MTGHLLTNMFLSHSQHFLTGIKKIMDRNMNLPCKKAMHTLEIDG